MTLVIVRRNYKRELQNANDIENDIWQGKYNMKMTLIEVKTRKRDSHKHESDTCEI